MRAGLITFHRADNYGAVLQASALLKYININICECELIDYLPNNISIPDNSILRKLLRFVKKTVVNLMSRNMMVKKKKFEEFRHENYILSRNLYYGDEMIYKNPPKYDVLISGSDQILNLTLSSNSISYYLAFDNKTKKISYGSSFGRNDISEFEELAICNYLAKFDSLSVREKSAIDLLENRLNMKVENVVDPVFLISKEEWETVADEKHIPNKKYIFVYAMENTDVIRNVVESASKKYKLPIVKVSGGCNMDGILGIEEKQCGPKQFLAYIKNAEYIITNSFHGLSFSHIFGKKFFSIAHTKRNSRIEDLLEISGNADKLIYTFENDILSKQIFGDEAFGKMHEIIEKSKEYLKRSILE